jgi:signal transduction histidine kinase
MFDPLFTTKPDGTGLGLTIVRRIVDEHHGTIDVSSEVGKGTTFRVLFPCIPQAA